MKKKISSMNKITFNIGINISNIFHNKSYHPGPTQYINKPHPK